jgi:RNAse (barnase) inhibitor barstar
MSEIEFTDDPSAPLQVQGYIARLSNIDGKNELLVSIGRELRFPDYYGYNWDALEECLRDLSWINEKEVLLVHEDLPRLEGQDLRTYIHILSAAVNSWESDSVHQLRVTFSKSDEPRVRPLLD